MQFLIAHFAILNACCTLETKNVELLQASIVRARSRLTAREDFPLNFSLATATTRTMARSRGKITEDESKQSAWIYFRFWHLVQWGLCNFYLEFVHYNFRLMIFLFNTELPNIFIPKKLHFFLYLFWYY